MKSFEKYIKNSAGSFQMEPLPDSFDKIMEALEKKKKRRFILWLWIIIPGIVLGGTGIYIGQHYSSTKSAYTATTLGNLNQEAIIPHPTENVDQVKNSTYTTTSTLYNSTLQVSSKKENIDHSEVKDQKGNVNKNISSNHEPLTDDPSIVTAIRENKTSLDIRTNTTTIDLQKRENEFLVVPLNNRFNFLPYKQEPLTLQRKVIPTANYFKPINKNNFSKWSLGIYSQVGASKSIFINNNDSSGSNYANIRTSTDQFLFSYSAGLNVRFSPVKFLAIETGIGFTHYESSQIITNGGAASLGTMELTDLDTAITLFSSSANSKEYHNTYDYISIPLKLYYQKKWNWTGIEAGAGVVFDIPINTSSYVADENSGLSFLRKDVKEARLNMFGIQASLNLNMVFHAKRFSFFVGPVFKYRLNSMFDDNYLIKQHHYFIGAEMGVRYNF